MSRKNFASWPGYIASIIALALIGVAGWMIGESYFATGVLVELAGAVGLLGLGHRWIRNAQRQRRRIEAEQVQI